MEGLLDITMNIAEKMENFYNQKIYKIGNNYVFGIWGLLMHLILLWGVLDVNFHSPIIQGLPNIPAPKSAPAKRLVLFVADGLRYRTFNDAPPKYLKQIMTHKGTWGISHTRIPTESRPGIIAICAGLYEDPSAIFKGWKENPVDFDSVFNQSYQTWAWGSPDIVPIFTKGTKKNVHGETYPHEWEDFDIIKGQIWRLDSWVFDKYQDWLENEANKVKDQDGIILFLHLLGCDTTGHTAKPESREYRNIMNYVDKRIEELVEKTENVFGHGTTAYVFTSDHGMTNWGSHGSGSMDETETPLVVWGAGVNRIDSSQDVEQVDITPLISSLVGIPIPVNNEGVLPWQYLNSSNPEYRSRSLLNNLKQLGHQVKANRATNCGDDKYTDRREVELDMKISQTEQRIDGGNIHSAIQESLKALKLAKESLSYFRQYQRSEFLMYLSIMWLSWIMFLLLKIAGVRRTSVETRYLLLTDISFALLLILIFARYGVYSCNNWRLPCYASIAVISLWLAVRRAVIYSPEIIVQRNTKSFIEIVGTVLFLVTMFTGLTYRFALSIGMLFAAIIQNMLLKRTRHFLFWTAISLAIFPILPVVEPYPREYIILLSVCTAIVITVLKVEVKYWKIMMLVRLIITGVVYARLIDGRSWMSWIILITTPLFITTCSTKVHERIPGIALSLFSPLVLLSASYEPFFFIILAIHLLCWPQFNVSRLQNSTANLLTTEEFLKAAFFMFYTLLCFFGTGNMASISSFDPSWTRHFVTLFSPFIMFSLIILKIAFPLMLIGCMTHVIGSSKNFLIILLLGDCLSLPLMYYVTPQGSWLDIGSAISRFTIAITLPCLLLLLHYMSHPLMTFHPKKIKFRIVPEKKHVV